MIPYKRFKDTKINNHKGKKGKNKRYQKQRYKVMSITNLDNDAVKPQRTWIPQFFICRAIIGLSFLFIRAFWIYLQGNSKLLRPPPRKINRWLKRIWCIFLKYIIKEESLESLAARI